jgi:hypothetical protein
MDGPDWNGALADQELRVLSMERSCEPQKENISSRRHPDVSRRFKNYVGGKLEELFHGAQQRVGLATAAGAEPEPEKAKSQLKCTGHCIADRNNGRVTGTSVDKPKGPNFEANAIN